MKLERSDFLNGKLVIDSAGVTIGRVTDVLGPWLEDPSYIEITLKAPFLWQRHLSFGSKRIFFPIANISVTNDVIKLDRVKKEIFGKKDFTLLSVMEVEGCQIASVVFKEGATDKKNSTHRVNV